MPVFWVEQKFTVNSQKIDQLKYALSVPWYARICSIIFIVTGMSMTFFKYLRRLCCNTTFVPHQTCSREEKNSNVIMTEAENPLISKIVTEKPIEKA